MTLIISSEKTFRAANRWQKKVQGYFSSHESWHIHWIAKTSRSRAYSRAWNFHLLPPFSAVNDISVNIIIISLCQGHEIFICDTFKVVYLICTRCDIPSANRHGSEAEGGEYGVKRQFHDFPSISGRRFLPNEMCLSMQTCEKFYSENLTKVPQKWGQNDINLMNIANGTLSAIYFSPTPTKSFFREINIMLSMFKYHRKLISHFQFHRSDSKQRARTLFYLQIYELKRFAFYFTICQQ